MTITAAQAIDLLAKPTVTVPEFARIVGVGRNMGYQLVREGKIRHLRIGARILIPSAAVREFLGG